MCIRDSWSAMLYDGTGYYFSKKYKMHIVDRVGGGDSFGGGLIYACSVSYTHLSSVLYKNPQSGRYYLVLKKESSDELSFSRTCNLLSEYGTRLRQDPAAEAYYAEHYEVIVKQNTLAVLAKI